MKTAKLINVVILLTCAASGVLFSCVKEDAMLARDNQYYESGSEKTFSLEDQAQLNRLASALAKETNSITLVEDAEVVDFTDSQGDFKAISVKYAIGNRITRMVVPLTEVTPDDTALKSSHTCYSVPPGGCVMKFTATHAECAYEIIERCKSLKGTGIESSTSVAFSDFKISRMNTTEAGSKSTTAITFDNGIVSGY